MPRSEPGRIAVTEFMSGGGEMGALMRAKDWSRTPLGPIETWPQSLRTVVQIMLGSRYAMWMGWGDDLTFFCNDAYRPTLGVKHPWALGASAREVWAEIWPDIGPRIEHVLRHGEATWDEGLLLFLERTAIPRRPTTPSPTARCATTTARSAACSASSPRRPSASSASAACASCANWPPASPPRARPTRSSMPSGKCLAAHQHDLPFTLTYLFEEDGKRARLVVEQRCRPGRSDRRARCSTATIDAAPWPIGGAAHRARADAHRESRGQIRGVAARRVGHPAAPGDGRADGTAGSDQPAGVFIAGLNPYRPLDDELSRLRRPGRRPDRRRRRQRARLRGGAPPRRGAGRDRSRQDRVLLQRQPRVPHAADPDAGPARGRCWRATPTADVVPSDRERARARAPQRRCAC